MPWPCVRCAQTNFDSESTSCRFCDHPKDSAVTPTTLPTSITPAPLTQPVFTPMQPHQMQPHHGPYNPTVPYQLFYTPPQGAFGGGGEYQMPSPSQVNNRVDQTRADLNLGAAGKASKEEQTKMKRAGQRVSLHLLNR
jgi:hypothetical protein